MRKTLVILAMLGATQIPSLASAQAVSLYTVEYTAYGTNESFGIGMYGAYQAPVAPASVLLGTPPNGRSAAEIVVEEHILHPGDSVPLPHYADGSEAAEADIFWTVHLWQAKFASYTRPYYAAAWPGGAGDVCNIAFSGRHYDGGGFSLDPYSGGPGTGNVDILVTVVAMRPMEPTPVRAQSLGGLKTLYR